MDTVTATFSAVTVATSVATTLQPQTQTVATTTGVTTGITTQHHDQTHRLVVIVIIPVAKLRTDNSHILTLSHSSYRIYMFRFSTTS